MKLFKEIFLGTTSNASNCMITNEKDITFNYKSDKDTLKAYALKPLKIENKSLGYRFTYFLGKFEYDRKDAILNLLGNIVFDDDMANKKTGESYERQRRNTYTGSKMQFFRMLWKDNLNGAGFILQNDSGKVLNYKNIVIEEKDNKKYLSFIRNLSLIYNPEDRYEKNDIYYYKNLPPSLL